MKSASIIGALTIGLLTLGACSIDGEEPLDCEGSCDTSSEFAPAIGPQSLIHCELVSVGSTNAMDCDFQGVPNSFPIDVSASITLLTSGFTGSNGQIQPGQTASYEFTEAGRVSILNDIPQQQFPVIVLVTLNASGAPGLSKLRSVQQTFTLTRVGDQTPDLPLPFDLWKIVAFAAGDGSAEGVRVGPNTITIAPWKLFLGETEINHEVALEKMDSNQVTYWLPVERGGAALVGRGRYCNKSSSFSCVDISFQLDGPGIYEFSSDGATRLGIDGPTAPDVEIPPSASCGTDGQSPCENGNCLSGFDLVQDMCVECGIDGESRCVDTNECSDGHRWNGSVCRVCGGDDQTFCGSYNNEQCDDGHRWNGSVCRVCGGDDQTFCGSYNNEQCDDGHRWNGSVCRVCGGDGQTYCGSYNDQQCDDGHRWNGSTCVLE